MKNTMYTEFFETLERRSRAGEQLSTGEAYAVRAWWQSEERHSDIFECDNLPFERDMASFVETLKEARVTRFAVTEKSSALLDNMHCLESLGCSLEGLGMVTRIEQRFGETQLTKLPAVIFTI